MAALINGADLTLYGGRDPRELPVYPLETAARFLLLPKSTLKAWVFGATWKPKGQPRRVFNPLIEPPDRNQQMLSFVNLVEAHVLKAIRRKFYVRMEQVRPSIEHLKQRFDTQHPLADVDLLAGNRGLFLEDKQHGQFLNIGMGKQIALGFLSAYLNRIDRQLDNERAIKLFPFVILPFKVGKRIIQHDARIVAIDPYTAYGRPIINGTGIPTKEIAERFWGGDSMPDLMEDFGRTQVEIEYALRWENAQAVHASE